MRKSFLRIALLLPLLTACTKEVVDDVNNGDYTDPQALSLNSDASQLASRLVMTGSKASRSAARSVAEKPAAPSLPTEYKQMPADGILKNHKYIADSFSGTIRCNENISASIYVTGEMTVTGIEGNPTELCIYVMEGAKLTWNIKDYFGFMSFPENQNLIVKSWGELTTGLTDHKGLRVYKGSSLHIINQTGSVLETQELMVEGKITSYVPVRVITKATISNGAKVNFHADAEIKNVNEDSANILDVSGGSEVYFGGCTYIGGEPVKHGAGSDMKVDGKSVLSIEKYLSVNGVVYVSGESRLNLLNKNSIFFNSQDMYLGMSEDPMLTGGHIYVGALCVSEADMTDEIRNVHIYTDEVKKGHDEYSPTLAWTELLLGGETRFIYTGEYNVPTCPMADAETPQLEEVAQILPPSRDYTYSATSIDFNGNRTYISWHTNPVHAGTEYGGVLDIVNIQNSTFEASLTNSLIKYNHALWNNGTMYLAGESDAKGAVLSRIQMTEEGLFPAEGVTEQTVMLNGRSANCVALLDENNLITASSGDTKRQGGFNIFSKTVEKLDETSVFVQAEKAKYVYKKGNELLTLNDMSQGYTKLYDYTSGGDLATALNTPKKTFRAGKIAPEDGKNVSMFDDQYIYICMGENGLKIYQRDGWPLGVYGVKQVNGVDSDENYIYLAHGYGVSVIDKATGRIMTTKSNDGASANFVRKGADGRIYVAYGTSGLRVFELK